MIKTKDKLSASVRQAKADQTPETDVPADAAETAKPAEKATTTAKPQSAPLKQAARKRPAARKPAARKPAASARKTSTASGSRKAGARKKPQSDEIPESGSALFPKRVWPD
ncbi:hypothetical protein [Thioalkalivibrio sp.]|uniref:hypothetical protein n=1 Tax=Thioalkalivibrio sp. TaxID=2093813 RepID=UPI003975AE98